jgi:peptidylprolyl isomerase
MSNIVESGNTVALHYRGTLDDGEQFDNSYERGEPLTFQSGVGQVVPGFETAVMGMTIGETKAFTLQPDEAYGPAHPEAVQQVPHSAFAPGMDLSEGTVIQGQAPDGSPMMARVVSNDEDTVTVDMNHPLAGKSLTFEVEIVSIT